MSLVAYREVLGQEVELSQGLSGYCKVAQVFV